MGGPSHPAWNIQFELGCLWSHERVWRIFWSDQQFSHVNQCSKSIWGQPSCNQACGQWEKYSCTSHFCKGSKEVQPYIGGRKRPSIPVTLIPSCCRWKVGQRSRCQFLYPPYLACIGRKYCPYHLGQSLHVFDSHTPQYIFHS